MRLCLVLDLRGGNSGPASATSSTTIEDGRGGSVGFCVSNSKVMRSASGDSLIVAVDFERSQVRALDFPSRIYMFRSVEICPRTLSVVTRKCLMWMIA